MFAPQSIMTTWEKFDGFPMETLTKVWVYKNSNGKKQREVNMMREHHQQYGMSGNCFDLTIWLLDEFNKDGIEAYPIGHDLHTKDAHVAVIAVNEHGNRFLCDLGDQWLRPILIDHDSEDFSGEQLAGFFPAAKVQVQQMKKKIEILYHRPNGKVSRQTYSTLPIEQKEFLDAAEFSQHIIKPRPLVECRIPYQSETAHWEFYNWHSFLSTTDGLIDDPKVEALTDWAERINQRTGYDKVVLLEVLKQYKAMSDKN